MEFFPSLKGENYLYTNVLIQGCDYILKRETKKNSG